MSQKQTKQSGFTLVELLIVVVIIAILAAITIVAYNGIQNRARASSAQSLANTIAKKAEAFNSLESYYPTAAVFTANTGANTAGNPLEAKLENTGSVITVAPTAANGTTAVQYVPCGTAPNHTGARIHWWDFVNSRVTTNATSPASVTVGTGC